jgi:hypothetical protein
MYYVSLVIGEGARVFSKEIKAVSYIQAAEQALAAFGVANEGKEAAAHNEVRVACVAEV